MPPLKDKGRRDHGIPDGESALEVKWINGKTPGGRAARSAGLRYGDIVVALAGKPFNMPTKEFNLYIKLNYKVGQELPLTVLRDGKRRDIKIKLVE